MATPNCKENSLSTDRRGNDMKAITFTCLLSLLLAFIAVSTGCISVAPANEDAMAKSFSPPPTATWIYFVGACPVNVDNRIVTDALMSKCFVLLEVPPGEHHLETFNDGGALFATDKDQGRLTIRTSPASIHFITCKATFSGKAGTFRVLTSEAGKQMVREGHLQKKVTFIQAKHQDF